MAVNSQFFAGKSRGWSEVKYLVVADPLNCKCLNSTKYVPWRRLPPQVQVTVLLLNETRRVGLEQRLFSIDIYVKGYRPIPLRVYQYETRPDANRNYTDLAIDMQISLMTRTSLPLLSTPAFVS